MSGNEALSCCAEETVGPPREEVDLEEHEHTHTHIHKLRVIKLFVNVKVHWKPAVLFLCVYYYNT